MSAICVFCLPLCLPAQQNKLAIGQVKEITIKRGGTATESLRVIVQSGFHVNSDKPKDEFVIPLKLTWSDGLLEPKSIRYPAPEEMKVGTDTLTVFTGTFNVETEFKAPDNAPPGPAIMTGKLRYQACNNQMCFRPTTADVRLPVLVE